MAAVEASVPDFGPAIIERKLASVRTVLDVRPIEGADNIAVAVIDGWTVVIKKGEVVPGDLVVYFEIDSLLPLDPRYEFLRASSYKKTDDFEGFRLKTIRLRKQLSQGLCLPLSSFPELADPPVALGDDVTERLHVLKYEPPFFAVGGPGANLSGTAKGTFPSFIQKTDAERIQNLTRYFHIPELQDVDFEVSLKLDGTSFTCYHFNGRTGVCSRNLELVEDDTNLYWKIARQYNLPARLLAYGRNIAVQGEIIGEGIQRNPEALVGIDLYLFSIYDIDAAGYLYFEDRDAVLKALNAAADQPVIKHVPVLGIEPIFKRIRNIDEMLAFADGPSLTNAIREGLVFKSRPVHGRVICFKAISNQFLERDSKPNAPSKVAAKKAGGGGGGRGKRGGKPRGPRHERTAGAGADAGAGGADAGADAGGAGAEGAAAGGDGGGDGGDGAGGDE